MIGDIPVPASISAPSESSQYLIPKGYYVLAAPGVAAVDSRIWARADKVRSPPPRLLISLGRGTVR